MVGRQSAEILPRFIHRRFGRFGFSTGLSDDAIIVARRPQFVERRRDCFRRELRPIEERDDGFNARFFIPGREVLDARSDTTQEAWMLMLLPLLHLRDHSHPKEFSAPPLVLLSGTLLSTNGSDHFTRSTCALGGRYAGVVSFMVLVPDKPSLRTQFGQIGEILTAMQALPTGGGAGSRIRCAERRNLCRRRGRL